MITLKNIGPNNKISILFYFVSVKKQQNKIKTVKANCLNLYEYLYFKMFVC